MDINITIKCPDLTLAASAIAKALLGARAETTVPEAPASHTPASATFASPAPAAVPVTPTPAAAAVPTVPTAPAPQITLAQLSKAGADLLMGKPDAMPLLMGLLQKFGVQDVVQLRPEQIGSFATELRGLGAKI